MKKKLSPHWKKDSDKHDYQAAANFLTLLMEPERAKEIASRFKKTSVSTFLVKDLLRASRLQLLPTENYHVKKDLKKVKEGSLLSPVLLVRGEIESDRPLMIADGYHRVCASYYLDENAEIPCHLVTL
jgi:hypothetical protein